MKELLDKEIDRHFRPEFINRLDSKIVFRALTKEDLTSIVEFELRKVLKRIIEHGLHLEISDATKEFLIEKGYSSEFGARPLRRAIEKYVEDPLSESLLRGEFKGKDVIKIDVLDEDNLRFKGIKSGKSKDKTNDKKKEKIAAGTDKKE